MYAPPPIDYQLSLELLEEHDDEDRENPNKNLTEDLNPDLDFGKSNEKSKRGLGLIQTRI